MKFKALVLALSFTFAAAPVMAVTAENCMNMTDLVRALAKARDRGTSFDKARSILDGGPGPAKAKTMADMLASMVYSNLTLTPDQLAAQTFQGCLDALAR
jgi:hypothetical protein